MKFLSLILATLFISNTTLASSNIVTERLNNAFDRLTYDLTVNWDQKDVVAKDTMLGEFNNELASLRQMGLTESELQNTLEMRLIDTKQVTEFRQTLSAMSLANKSSEEIARASLPFLNASLKSGAHYRSSVVIYGPSLGVVIVASIVVSLILSSPWGNSVVVYY